MDARPQYASPLAPGVPGSPEGAYLLWNLRLLEAFFSPASSHDEAWLQVSPTELDSLAPDLGGDEGFRKALARGAPWLREVPNPGTAFVQRARLLADQRRGLAPRPPGYVDPGKMSIAYAGRNAPTYIPYLAALVRSAAVAREGFYQHLHAELGLPPSWGSNEMSSLQPVWDDLQRWTDDCRGELGIFKVRVLGGYRLIGLAKSQSIISLHDASLLGRVFAQVGLRPGQQLSATQLSDIRTRAADSFFLSAGFRDALGSAEYEEPINERLGAIFADWDGTVPSRISQANGTGAVPRSADTERGVGLCLTLKDDAEFPWRIHWRIPSMRDAGKVVLRHGDKRWGAWLSGTDGATTSEDLDSVTQAAASTCLSSVERGDIEFDASYVDDGSVESPLGKFLFPRRLVRVLVWAYDPLLDRHELREHPFPLNGQALLLAPPDNARRLVEYLERERIPCEPAPTDGLPPGWVLVAIKDCSALSIEQRDALPDGSDERSSPRVLRFVGGRSVSRGGIRQYLSYDLPQLELDAPQGTHVQGTGLDVVEEQSDGGRSAVRKFRLERLQPGLGSFHIRAIQFGRALSEIRLRVAAESGTVVAPGRKFVLDAFGSASPDAVGLRGTLVGVTADGEPVPRYSVTRRDLGTPVDAVHAEQSQGGAVARFLDALAQAGSMDFGSARDQLQRLLAREQTLEFAGPVLLSLRSRGHLELETDHKGHLIRVHAVPPGMYELAISAGGQHVVGILGTLRLAHWQWLASLSSAQAISSHHRSKSLDTWRLLVDEGNGGPEIAVRGGFEWHRVTPVDVARWAPDFQTVRQLIGGWAVQKLDTGENATKFSAGTGLFVKTQSGLAVDEGVECQLFKTEDAATRRHDVYVLGFRPVSGYSSFAFVRDSRWGVWLAMGAFADFVRLRYQITDASPWPIPYMAGSGTLWLPARIRLPAVLERALVMCSGDDPEVVDAVGEFDSHGMAALRHSRPALGTPSVSGVYGKMANGKWLAYRWVPREVADVVATKLGAAISDA